MNTHTTKWDAKNLLHGLGVLMATTSQYCNLSSIYEGKTTQLQAIKGVKGDHSFNVLHYTKEYLAEVQTLVDIEQEIETVFEGFMKEASLVPCHKSELKTFFQLMYNALTHT